MADSKLTTSQTIGPFPHEGWQWAVDATAAGSGAALTISGAVLDGAGKPVDDAVLEAWSPTAADVRFDSTDSSQAPTRVNTCEGMCRACGDAGAIDA